MPETPWPPHAQIPFVSVVIPTHARCRMLARLLASLAAQHWPADRWEIIVVHNQSADGTADVVATRAAASPVPIRYIPTRFTRPGPSRQAGADAARGSILAFIDDDCVADPRWLAAGAAAIAGGLSLAQGRTIPNPSQPRHLLEHTVTVTGPTPFFETCNIFYDAAVFRAVGGFPASFRDRRSGEDTSLGWAMRSAGHPTGYCDAALVHHEVFRVSYPRWLLRMLILEQVPYLVRAFPAMRTELYLGVFFSRLTAAFDLLLLGLIGVVLGYPAFAALALPYVVLRLAERGRHRSPILRLGRLVFGLPRSAVMGAVLLVSSARARCLVL